MTISANTGLGGHVHSESAGIPGIRQDVVIQDRDKNVVFLYEDRVRKVYKPMDGRLRRFRAECAALERLHGVAGVPRVLSVDPTQFVLVMTRVCGEPFNEARDVPDIFFDDLRRIVREMLGRGVARAAVRASDLVVQKDGRVGLVDFERVILRAEEGWLSWMFGCIATRGTLLRLLAERAPRRMAHLQRAELRFWHAVRWLFRKLPLAWRTNIDRRVPSTLGPPP